MRTNTERAESNLEWGRSGVGQVLGTLGEFLPQKGDSILFFPPLNVSRMRNSFSKKHAFKLDSIFPKVILKCLCLETNPEKECDYDVAVR